MTFHSAEDQGPVIRGRRVLDARFIRTDEGLWVGKGPVKFGMDGVRSEVVAAVVGQLIGAPLPPAAVWWRPDDSPFFLSRYLDPAEPWRAGVASDIRNERDIAATLVLDFLIGNHDRTADNILVRPTDNGPVITAIDHEKAVVGRYETVPSSHRSVSGAPTTFHGHSGAHSHIPWIVLELLAISPDQWSEAAWMVAQIVPQTDAPALAEWLEERSGGYVLSAVATLINQAVA